MEDHLKKEMKAYIFLFKPNFLFEMIVDLHAVVRDDIEKYHVPFTQLPLRVITFKTIGQYYNWDIDNKVNVQYIFTPTWISHLAFLQPYPVPSH